MGKLRKRMSFSRIGEVLEMPDLIEVQKNSYQRFLDVDLREVLMDASPITDYSGTLELTFENYALGEPKHTMERCRERDLTYAAPLSFDITLRNKTNVDDIKRSSVWMGEFPLMTENGTFIINGAEHDIYGYYLDYLKNRKNLNVWLNELNRQQTTFPKNYVKSHCLENHDQARSAAFVKDEVRIRNLNALIYFLRGITFIYAGQEALDEKLESLFDVDLVCWDNLGKYDLVSLMRRCSEIKKDKLFALGNYDIILEDLEVAHLKYESKEEIMEIILNVGNVEGKVKVSLKDGEYINIFDNEKVCVIDSFVEINKNPLLIKTKK